MQTGIDRDECQRQLGQRDERLRVLERVNAYQKEIWETAATKWQRMLRHRDELAEWLIDMATDERGRIIKPEIDAALGGEDFVPCTMSYTYRGKRYRIKLSSTCYTIEYGH
jgi:hypothetical protein